MEGMNFTYQNVGFVVVRSNECSQNFTDQLGWSHWAEVKRTNGKKSYFANLLVVNEEVLDSLVVL
jgi:hypothetical protein